jgi:hypothetical protein
MDTPGKRRLRRKMMPIFSGVAPSETSNIAGISAGEKGDPSDWAKLVDSASLMKTGMSLLQELDFS